MTVKRVETEFSLCVVIKIVAVYGKCVFLISECYDCG